MAKPVIWTVHDDPDVLRPSSAICPALWRPLQGDLCRLRGLRAGSEQAIETPSRTRRAFLVDQRMPRMSGVEFLERAIEFYPAPERRLFRLRGH